MITDRKRNILALAGRILFSLIFILSGPGHFSDRMIEVGQQKEVPFAEVAVPLAGVLAILGGLSIALGWKARLGAVLIILFLVPVTAMMHNFWTLDDVMQRQTQQIMFMKNISMLGGAFFIAYFGAGPLSLDRRKRKEEGKLL